MKKFKQLQLSFDLPLYHRQIPQWRGAIIEWAGIENDLFHNHKTGTDRYYRYPQIQYYIHQQKAAILAINQGADQLEQLLAEKDWILQWQGQPTPLPIDQAQLDWPTVALSDQLHRYNLQHWLPFNQDNYHWWKNEANSLTQRVGKLEKTLLSHILTFATGIRWQIPGRVQVHIQNIRKTKKLRFHGTPMVAFDLSFDSNLILPPNIRLGRVVSHGFGELKPFYQPKKQVAKRILKKTQNDRLEESIL